MRLESIELMNFRQFRGAENEILFSTDKEKNVTLIMGDNGVGKTTLAQAFCWCLYGRTEFTDEMLLCRAVSQELKIEDTADVEIRVKLIHNNERYEISRKSMYRKMTIDNVKPINTTVTIIKRQTNGQTEKLNEKDAILEIKNILPQALSKYIFLSGEKVTDIGKELNKVINKSKKSDTMLEAVTDLLGLKALKNAIAHLQGENNIKGVIQNYDTKFKTRANKNFDEALGKKDEISEKLNKDKMELEKIKEYQAINEKKIREYENKIANGQDSQELAKARKEVENEEKALIEKIENNRKILWNMVSDELVIYSSTNIIQQVIGVLKNDVKLEEDIPGINVETINFLLNRGKCLCGQEFTKGSKEYEEIEKILEEIPPQSIKSLICEFVREGEVKVESVRNFREEFENIKENISSYIKECERKEGEKNEIDKSLEDLDSIGHIQGELDKSRNLQKKYKEDEENIIKRKVKYEMELEKLEADISKYSQATEENKKIAKYKAYASEILDRIEKDYTRKEEATRKDLENTINKIFREIYNGDDICLRIDENYNVRNYIGGFENFNDNIEMSTAQGISIIFAFIAGVLKIAKEKSDTGADDIYPLVLDAPLSAFDKERIKNICRALPKVAEQVIVFIKDTDGEVAQTYMKDKIGLRYNFRKINEFETIVEGER